MVHDKIIEGKYVKLKSVTLDDAQFTLSIRQDPEFSKYLPFLDINIDQQREWIKKQREKLDDYFFVVFDKHDNRIGTLSIYDISGQKAEAGRLAIKGNAFESYEAQYLSFLFGFYDLNLDEIISYIYAENSRAIRFTKQFGGVVHEPEMKNGRLECLVTNTKTDFIKCEKKLKAMLYRSK